MNKDSLILFHHLVPIPVTSLSVTHLSNTTITVNWTSPSNKNGNYVTYYNIFYSPLCPLLTSVNVTLIFITPPTTIFSYTLSDLLSGTSYIITVRAGNVFGQSSPVMIFDETKPTSGKRYLLILFIK